MSLISSLGSTGAVQAFIGGGAEALKSVLNSRVSQVFVAGLIALSYLPGADSYSYRPRKRKTFDCDKIVEKRLDKAEGEMDRKYQPKERETEKAKMLKQCKEEVEKYNRNYDKFDLFAFVATVIFIGWHNGQLNRLERDLNERILRRI